MGDRIFEIETQLIDKIYNRETEEVTYENVKLTVKGRKIINV